MLSPIRVEHRELPPNAVSVDSPARTQRSGLEEGTIPDQRKQEMSPATMSHRWMTRSLRAQRTHTTTGYVDGPQQQDWPQQQDGSEE